MMNLIDSLVIGPHTTVAEIARICEQYSTPGKNVVARIEHINGRPVAYLKYEATAHIDAHDVDAVLPTPAVRALLKERDALAAKVASYERADRDLNEALNMGDGSYRP